MHKGSQVSFAVSIGNSGWLSRSCRGKWPHLGLMGKSCGFSRVVVGSLVFLLSCDRDLREPHVLPQESQVSFRVVRGSTGFLLSNCRGIRPHLALRAESHGVSRFAAGSFGFLSNCDRNLREALGLIQRSQVSFGVPRVALDSSRVTAGNRASSRIEGAISLVFLELLWEALGSFQVATGTQ